MSSRWQHYVDQAVTDKDEQSVDMLIDAHTHVGQVRQYDLPVAPERMIEYMNDYGVDKAVLFPLESPEASAHTSRPGTSSTRRTATPTGSSPSAPSTPVRTPTTTTDRSASRTPSKSTSRAVRAVSGS